ncbi:MULTISPECIES: GTP-sensing pleiotropic transcriptional regulator CodY [Clostridium]|uniref:Global transcriptional regulator CodY n=1 Tax=Clostridium novyi (strain NT) TaxID=386415 RepID=A0Q0S1_CLONN|nr:MULTISPECIES: GTP-sensing pleiotropic transcriptional regulator CodY [Clostridium]ABK60455.1 transcription pleiotropic repressor codY, putative [Clostridium novyi NT]KEH88598.1 GTP-sensing transcriptional pleiotropic repressor CodY [Clostridium novyi A str. NCTC 538]KEH89537.1 GTP-sensing transcriptional pleiotropic repressor CodY [Clostridium novyi A str. 4540]KEH90700.1 GTP-sensing transcriptional pleiotropic repressor CodY [Clostridium novyi A str. BKT29909]KEH94494.1 GTP-sensing transcr
MASELLTKIRRLNKIIQKTGAEPVVFDDICHSLSEVLECNVYIISRKGKILGHRFFNGVECESIKEKVVSERKFPEKFNSKLLSINETISNIENNGKSSFDEKKPAEMEGKLSTIVPIVGNRERLGTLFLTRFEGLFSDEDLILSEYSATIVGLEILRAKNDALEDEARKKAVVQLAIGTLSYSELEAVEHVFNELDGNEGLLVASKIADKVGITRSVIVNALRKFESAGVIESRSLGMKGTHIKILNDKLLDELKKIK